MAVLWARACSVTFNCVAILIVPQNYAHLLTPHEAMRVSFRGKPATIRFAE